MSKIFAAAFALAAFVAPVSSFAQTTPAPAPAAAPLTVNSPIKALLANPATKAILDKHLPALAGHPALTQIQDMSLPQVAPMSQGNITDEILAAIDTDIKALAAH